VDLFCFGIDCNSTLLSKSNKSPFCIRDIRLQSPLKTFIAIKISICQNKVLTLLISIHAQSSFDSCKCFPFSGFDLCFLTPGISFLSSDNKGGNVFLHVPSPSEGQESQQKTGNIIIYY